MKKTQYKVIFIDFHGTVVKPYPSYGSIYSSVAKRFGITIDEYRADRSFKEVWNSIGHDKISSDSFSLTTRDGLQEWWENLHSRVIMRETRTDLKTAKKFSRAFHRNYFSNPHIFRLVRGGRETLKKLRDRGYVLVLLINADTDVNIIIDSLDLRRYFDDVIISTEVGMSKPDPKIITQKLKQLCVEPDKVLVVGDSYPHDIVAAKRAGCSSCIVNADKEKYRDRVDYCIENISQLMKFL